GREMEDMGRIKTTFSWGQDGIIGSKDGQNDPSRAGTLAEPLVGSPGTWPGKGDPGSGKPPGWGRPSLQPRGVAPADALPGGRAAVPRRGRRNRSDAGRGGALLCPGAMDFSLGFPQAVPLSRGPLGSRAGAIDSAGREPA